MKKYLMCALIPCAIPLAAFGQVNVTCADCTHVVSVYQGEGGFIATADDADMVTWVATCGGVTTSGELEPNDDGKVAALFTMDNGLACDSDKGSFELGPVMDGGWFWITDDMNSAVGSLVSKDILDNEATMITSAGDGVTMMDGAGAVYLKETATGRVGILPDILPKPPVAPAAICGPRIPPGEKFYSVQMTKNCMLGGGGSKIRIQGPAPHGGFSHLASGIVTRNRNGGDVVLRADLWVDESGSYSTGDPPTPNKGWVGKGDDNWLSYVGWIASLDGAPPGATLAGAGVEITDSNNDGQAEIAVSPSPTSYCPATGSQTTAVVNVRAFPKETEGATMGGEPDALHPMLSTSRALGGAHAGIQLTVMCPPRSSSANLGQELVPENPFPPTSE